ncbi:Uncharacterized protein APZ42_016032 [Daphnia magna]|uniref:Uncharacterized protein n=1 Tax=Daphnia magna TaxID=35525 RepID=A0A162NHH5_9CRUS|nr:Uncharacterized protein APZ42_016032 [Daphnia magna]
MPATFFVSFIIFASPKSPPYNEILISLKCLLKEKNFFFVFIRKITILAKGKNDKTLSQLCAPNSSISLGRVLFFLCE